MVFSNDPRPSPYADIPSPLPNIDFPEPFWINKLARLLIIGCTNPDLAYAALLVPAAAKMMWSVETPSTKQIIHSAAGRSWICGSKQVLSQVQEGEKIAQSSTGRFVYGMVAGLDIAAYHAFFLSTGAAGLINYASLLAKFSRVCNHNQSPYRGVDPVGGWPSDIGGLQTGPSFFNSSGTLLGPFVFAAAGEVAIIMAWCSFSVIGGSGGIIARLSIVDFDTGQVYDEDIVNNLFSTEDCAVVNYFTSEGRLLRDTTFALKVEFLASTGARAGTAQGGSYMRNFRPGAGDAPPYFDLQTMLEPQIGGPA